MFSPTKKQFIRLAKKGNLIPVYKEILADVETPVSCFAKIDKGGYSYLLESVEGAEKVARFSFIGMNPSLIFKSKNSCVEISVGGKKTRKMTTDPLRDLEDLMSKYKFVHTQDLPRFCGGFVGYLGYDMVRFFEKLPDKNPDDLKLPDAVFMLNQTVLVFDHINHKIKVVSNAYVKSKDKKDIEKAYSDAVRNIDAIINKLRQRTGVLPFDGKKKKAQPIKVESNFRKDDFKKAVTEIKKYIRQGCCVQTVLSQRFKTPLAAKPLDIYRALRSINPSPYMFYLKFKDIIMAGSSPELLVRLEDNIVQTRPIAGTRPRGKTQREDLRLEKELLADPKELSEHVMLVDLGRNDLGRVCRFGTVKVPEKMIIERYSHVMHIVSGVEGVLKKGNDQFDVIRAAFPAGTVTGAPKIRAMEIIDELENVRRGPYAGCVGYFSFSGNMDTCITIRTIIIKGKNCYIQAGAGIVAESRPEKEFKETQNKAKAMIRAIEMAQKGLQEE